MTDAVWHPTKKYLFITASADSTVRVWNTDNTQLNNSLKVGTMCKSQNADVSVPTSLTLALSPLRLSPDILSPAQASICGKCRTKKGKRAALSTVDISADGKLIAVGAEGGSIHTFALGEKHMIPKAQNHTAHAEDSTVTSLKFSRKGKLLSRGTDGGIAIWDPRRITRGPLVQRKDLPCYYPMTEAVFSPDEKLVLTGLSVRPSLCPLVGHL